MKRIDSKYNKEAWSEGPNELGNIEVSTIRGDLICEMKHPVLIEEQNRLQYEELVKQFKANVLLVKHCNAVAEHLEKIYESLIELKTGKKTIFDFDLDKAIKETEIVLLRATKLD